MINLLIIIIILQLFSSLSDASSRVNPVCLLAKCRQAVLKCNHEQHCRKMLTCMSLCFGKERCQMECTLDHGSESATLSEFLNCIKTSNCMKIPADSPICPIPSQRLPFFNLSTLLGDWWVEFGWNRVYDCWNCQRMGFSQINATLLDYKYDMLVKGEKLRSIPCKVTQPELNSSRLIANYLIQDVLNGQDDWHVLDNYDNNYLLLYYCGKSDLSAEYQGAIIMRNFKAPPTPREVLERFQLVLNRSGLNLSVDKFCRNRIDGCPQALSFVNSKLILNL